MKNVYIIVEGQSEENFIKKILAPYFANQNIYLTAERVITGKNSFGKACKGGGTSYKLYKNHLSKRIKQFKNQQQYKFSTMIDFYALPTDFPKFETLNKSLDKYQQIEFLEKNFFEDINSTNFIPYIQLHEFETLLFNDLSKIADEFFDISCDLNSFEKDISSYENLELINSSKENAPSKRIDKFVHGNYCGSKVTSSFNILKDTSVETLRKKFKHFDSWLSKIEQC